MNEFVPMPDLARTYRVVRYTTAGCKVAAVVNASVMLWSLATHRWWLVALNLPAFILNERAITRGTQDRDALEATMMEMPEYFAVVDGKWRQIAN